MLTVRADWACGPVAAEQNSHKWPLKRIAFQMEHPGEFAEQFGSLLHG
jgi:hypothetical protein